MKYVNVQISFFKYSHSFWIKSAERSGHATAGAAEDKDLKMLVHQSQAGAIIGRAGFKIKELREVSPARHLITFTRLWSPLREASVYTMPV